MKGWIASLMVGWEKKKKKKKPKPTLKTGKNVKMGIFFRHDDLKEMLDSNKDSLKLEAMKRIVAVGIAVTGGDHC